MSTILPSNSAVPSAPVVGSGADPLCNPPGAGADVRISKADGLRGALGLYQVDIGNETRYMTREELESADFQRGGGDAAATGGLADVAGGGPGAAGHTGHGGHAAGTTHNKHHEDGGKASGTTAKLDPDLKSAEDFRKHADDKLKAAHVPADQRKRITDYLATLSGPALVREARLLDHALKSPNADRAIGTYDKTLSMSKESPRAAERLTPAMRAELVRGVADSRTGTAKGVEGVLGQHQAEVAARALIDMPKAEYDRLQGAMDHAGLKSDGKPAKGADAHTECALMLKAVAARADRLKETPLDIEAQKKHVCMDTPAGRAMGEITGFAGEIRGMKREELIRNTSSLAINRVDRGPDTDKLTEGNTKKNVGHYQRYDSSCGPTTAQNMQAERDPIFAMKLRKEANNPGVDSDLARQQKAVLEKPHFYDAAGNEVKATPAQVAQWQKDKTLPPGATVGEAGVAYSRLGDQAEGKLDARLNSNWALKHITTPEYDAASKYMTNQKTTPAEDALARQAFAKIAKKDGGHPTAMELQAMRSNYTQNADGTSTKKPSGVGMRLPAALNDIAPPEAGKTWKAQATNGGSGGLNAADIATLDTKLKAGIDVPIRICDSGGNGGHFMMISDVRGEGANKKYLVSDPWTGKTAWVKQADLQNFGSNWPQTYFSKDLANGISHIYTEQ